MGELSIRRNRGFAVPRFQKTGKTEKQASAGPARRTDNRTVVTVSETLKELMGRVSQAERHVREGRRTLQTEEASLAEVQDNLEHMEELAQESAEGGDVDRAALQEKLERLLGEIDRIARDGIRAGLFQDGGGDGLDAMIDAVLDGLAAQKGEAQGLPVWLLRGMAGSVPDKAALLAALGLDDTASGPELLAALSRLPLEDSAAAGYLAALYLGAVISGGVPSGEVDPAQAAEGLRQLLETVAEGVSLDQAVELLTGGTFASLADFQAQFTGGTAPGLQTFLVELLLSGETLGSAPSVLTLLAGGGGGDLELLMGLLTALENSGAGLMELLENADVSAGAAIPLDIPETGTVPQMETRELGTVQAAGRDLSGVAVDPETGVLTADTAGELILRGLGQESPALRFIGSGTIILQQVNAPFLAAESAQAQVASAGESALAQVRLGEGTTLTLDGGGLLRIGQIQGGASSVLRLTGGAVVLDADGQSGSPAVQIVVDGPVSLLAPRETVVRDAQGRPLEPFDIVWKTLLPEWSAVTSLAVDGRQGRLTMARDGYSDLIRLWLLKEDSSQGYPAHAVVLQGRDQAGRLKTRYAYLRWSRREGAFREVSMYPNPFTVTGGELDLDWRYEEESRTLRILSSQVTAVTGGIGTDANELPFSGRIALADGIGAVELTLGGVDCRVPSGRAFSLGRGNDVTLLLQSGTDNMFESGAGCAGISLGDGTSLRIDRARDAKGMSAGTLTAAGGAGGAGIGRDSGAGQERTGPILICGGVITVSGTGGGAGIGGALGSCVGDIRIQGGTVSAEADCGAAAIGAGLQGSCGDIVITGAARVVKAQGGGLDGDIGGCLFGSCGKVQVSAGTDIGGARLWTQRGLTLQMGDAAVTLPRFRVSAQALRLDELNISTREGAKSAMAVLAADRRWVGRLQEACGAMYGQIAQSFGGLYSIHRYFGVVRDTGEAGALLGDTRQALLQSPAAAYSRRGMEDVGRLLR